MIFMIFQNRSGATMVPSIYRKNQVYHRKERQKLWGLISRMIHLMNFSHWKLGSKGVTLCRQEEPPLGSLAVACHREESASHHVEWLLMTPRCVLSIPRLILRTSFFHDFSWFSKIDHYSGWSRCSTGKLSIPSERASKIIIPQIKNHSFDQL